LSRGWEFMFGELGKCAVRGLERAKAGVCLRQDIKMRYKSV
jgi:hypothetical protein